MKLPSRYELSGGSSGGGMGDIYFCSDKHLQRDVVLKLLKDGEEERRLLDEQKALIQRKRPAIPGQGFSSRRQPTVEAEAARDVATAHRGG